MNKYFRTIPGILQHHHYRFDSLFPGKVFAKSHSTASEEVIKLISDTSRFDSLAMPHTITPAGMSFDRQVHLYEKIRPFCTSQAAALLTCPAPASDPTPASDPAPLTVEEDKEMQPLSSIRSHKTVRGVTTCPKLLNS